MTTPDENIDPKPREIPAQPKFKVGQIVVMKGLKKQLPFRILEIVRNEYGIFYRWDRKNCAAESMIRELTEDEKGGEQHA